jgi:hypothetical protein
MLFSPGEMPVLPAPLRYALYRSVQSSAVGFPSYHPSSLSRFCPVMFEPKKGETSVPFAAIPVRFGEVYQLRLFRVYGQPVFGKPKRSSLSLSGRRPQTFGLISFRTR